MQLAAQTYTWRYMSRNTNVTLYTHTWRYIHVALHTRGACWLMAEAVKPPHPIPHTASPDETWRRLAAQIFAHFQEHVTRRSVALLIPILENEATLMQLTFGDFCTRRSS